MRAAEIEDNPDAAVEQFRAVTRIDPDFRRGDGAYEHFQGDPAVHARARDGIRLRRCAARNPASSLILAGLRVAPDRLPEAEEYREIVKDLYYQGRAT